MIMGNKKMNIIQAVLLLNMVIPILAGLFVYLTSGHQTYISEYASKIGIEMRTINYPSIIRCYGCDFLWGYSLCSGLQLFVTDGLYRHALIKVITASMLIAITMECLQRLPFISGTFDIADIFVECGAICIAAFITNLFKRRHQNEKRCIE